MPQQVWIATEHIKSIKAKPQVTPHILSSFGIFCLSNVIELVHRRRHAHNHFMEFAATEVKPTLDTAMAGRKGR